MASISFVGDLRLLNPEKVKLSSKFEEILKRCEYNVLNFEAPIRAPLSCAIEKSGPVLTQSENAPQWVEANGWNVVSLANNHIFDYGELGLEYTIKSFDKALLLGAGTWEESYSYKVLDTLEGIRIGIIACSHHEFGALSDNKDKEKEGYAWIGHKQVIKCILDARDKVDYLIMYAHAGVENFLQPLPEWRECYHFFVDIGCDAVIATHPHIIQGWEEYKGKPIVYSLGNFCFQKDNISTSSSWNNSIACVLNLKLYSKISYDIYPLNYNYKEGIIEVVNNSEINTYIEGINKVLNDVVLYDEYINNELPKLWDEYLHLFSNSGFVNNFFSRNVLSVIKRKLMGKKTSYSHLLNNFQNESHRWAIERIIKISNHFV